MPFSVAITPRTRPCRRARQAGCRTAVVTTAANQASAASNTNLSTQTGLRENVTRTGGAVGSRHGWPWSTRRCTTGYARATARRNSSASRAQVTKTVERAENSSDTRKPSSRANCAFGVGATGPV